MSQNTLKVMYHCSSLVYHHNQLSSRQRHCNKSILILVFHASASGSAPQLMPVDFSFVCKRSPGRSARHHALNDLVARSFASAGVPVSKEPVGLLRSDSTRPDGVTLVPWQSGKSLCWDVTVTCPLAELYVDIAACEAGAAVEMAATREEVKYVDLSATSLSRLR